MKQTSILITILSITILFMSSCTRTREKKSSMLSVNIDKVPESEIPIKMSEIVETFDIVKFENKPEALLDATSNSISISDHYIAFMNNFRIMLFTREGKFIRTIGNYGRGPGEWFVIKQLEIDEEKGILLISQSNFTHDILEFSLEGRFIKKITMPFPKEEYSFKILNHDTIVVVGFSFGTQDSSIVFMQDFDGNLLNYYPSHLIDVDPIGRDLIYQKGNALNISRGDTIFNYQYKTKRLIPEAYFYTDYSIYPLTTFPVQTKNGTTIGRKFKKEPFNGSKEISVHFETDRYYILGYSYTSDNYTLGRNMIFNKSDKSLFIAKYINDFLGDIPFPVSFGRTYNNEYVYFQFTAFGFKSFLKEIEADSNLTDVQKEIIAKLDSGINENDSNILIICKIKMPSAAE
jgi:hypothetical protein